ncbi:MAG: energy transducer TonB [Bacteroidetes bacterium]|nr:energy transducer TonB [Bacteroidota bacterium]
MKNKNSKKVNLENKRGMFFQIGMIVSLVIVLAAFEWTTVSTYQITDWDLGRDIPIEEMTAITSQEKPKPLPKQKIQVSVIEIVPDDRDFEEPDIIFEEPDEGLNDPAYFFDEEPDEDQGEPVIFQVVEEQPTFPGGMEALYKYLGESINYPQIAREAGIDGPVYIKFIVWQDGSIRNIQLERGIGGGCDEEAFRVVKAMPNWIPGKQRSKPVNVQMVLPVNFKLL